jgi:poly(3-hydroxybutyrate) depolymerase
VPEPSTLSQSDQGNSPSKYVLAGAYDKVDMPPAGWPVVLVYHGGGETARQILEDSSLGNLAAVVVSIEGQEAHNGLSWMNAFPWLKPLREDGSPRNDVQVTQDILGEVGARFRLDMSRIYATGKSDGAGMAVFLAAHPELRNFDVRAIAPISGAYFGVQQTFRTQSYTFPATASGYQEIVLAPMAIPLLEMHGTADEVMNYRGQQVSTPGATERPGSLYGVDGSFWSPPAFPDYQAYTADIPSYWAAWGAPVDGASGNPTCQEFTCSDTYRCRLYIYSKPEDVPLYLVQVENGGHDWFGHTGEGASLQIDATTLISDFFGIPLIDYTAPVPTPSLPTVPPSGAP